MHSTTERAKDCQSLDSDALAKKETAKAFDEIYDQRATRMLIEIRTEFSVITGKDAKRKLLHGLRGTLIVGT